MKQNKKVIHMISDCILQLTSKKLTTSGSLGEYQRISTII